MKVIVKSDAPQEPVIEIWVVNENDGVHVRARHQGVPDDDYITLLRINERGLTRFEYTDKLGLATDKYGRIHLAEF